MAGQTAPSHRDRMVASAGELMRRRGVAGTSMLDALADSGAPRGSMYHYFPGGKAQLVAEATRASADAYSEALAVAMTLEPAQALELVVSVWRSIVADSDFTAGCPIVSAALGGDQVPAAREIAGQVFAGWTEAVELMLVRYTIPEAQARSLATLIVSSVEGAAILGLAQRSLEPMDRVAVELVRIVEAAIAASP